MRFAKGCYQVRFADSPADFAAALDLRRRVFRAGTDSDVDGFDPQCHHVLIETRDGTLVCCFRLLILGDGQEISRSYSAQFYGLGGLSRFEGPMIEIGRFCVHPELNDPDILRIAWAALTRLVDERGVELLFGCSSFQGTDADTHMDAFALLQDRHLAPQRWLPKIKAPSVVQFAQRLRGRAPDMKRAVRAMPPLLRSYLAMGGWVSDHAVVDSDLNTLHVFTALEIRAIPPARARLLRAESA